ncbi:dihydroneopterin aldolase [Fervidibacillus halotolerans]|uniref:7,8-dihydroneopterin aldolase n=1 Tax=Fervidibacillus halotolerans TaxID=2980027 RepID=A0A9E8RY08_9BACI|nr:dihydroneopterin aldolase [Fervidibacillus halotolerans]WAA12361.1 dihydroneopterin aldolase [Fervidibacillus halotolerans]
MDRIYLTGMEFYGYHGVFPEENKLGQPFIIDLTLDLDLRKAGETDDLTYTVNYGNIFLKCKQIVEGKAYKLIESVAEKIAETLLVDEPLIESCTVKVMKPKAPIPGRFHSAAVEITRTREGKK